MAPAFVPERKQTHKEQRSGGKDIEEEEWEEGRQEQRMRRTRNEVKRMTPKSVCGQKRFRTKV